MEISIFLQTLTLLFIFIILPEPVMPAIFSIANSCSFPIWPGILSGAGTPPLPVTGFLLNSGESRAIPMPPSWSGRLWARTRCSTNTSTGLFSCATADCNSGTVACSGSGAAPPATLAEFTLNGSGGMDFFDVSLVDGYNIPVIIAPQGGGGTAGMCGPTGCLVDLNGVCPSELLVIDGGEGVACRSACEAYGSPEYCCSGEYGGPDTCKPSPFSELFKNACPRAYSYAYDDSTSTFTCSAGTDYAITFCPSTTSLKSAGRGAGSNPRAAGLPLINDTMVFMRADYSRGATSNLMSAVDRAFVLLFIVIAWWLY